MLVTKYDTSGTWQELNRIRLWNGVMCILYWIVPVNFSSRFWSFYIRKLAFVNHWGIHSGCLFWLKDKLCHSSFSDETHDPNPQNQTNFNRRGLPWKQFFIGLWYGFHTDWSIGCKNGHQRKASSKASGMSLDSECLKWIFWKGWK